MQRQRRVTVPEVEIFPKKISRTSTREERNAYMRAWRKAHPPSEEERRRDRARSYAGTYMRRGLLTKQPCRVCGDPNSQMHHPDYNDPLRVEWLCKKHHRDLHDWPLSHVEHATPSGADQPMTST